MAMFRLVGALFVGAVVRFQLDMRFKMAFPIATLQLLATAFLRSSDHLLFDHHH